MYHGNSEITKELINAHADLNIKDDSGCTALMSAIVLAQKPMIALLIKAGADDRLTNNEGCTVLDKAQSPETRQVVIQTLETRNRILHSYTQISPEAPLRNTYAYLVAGPLAIPPLARLFLQYATEYVPVEYARQRAIEATERQQQ